MKEQTEKAALWAALEEDLEALWAAPEGEAPDWSADYDAWEADFLAGRAAPPARRARRRRKPPRAALIAAAAAVLLLAGCTAVVVTNPQVQETVRETVREVFRREIVYFGRPDAPKTILTDEEGNFQAEVQLWDVTFSDGTTDHYLSIGWEEGALDYVMFSEELGVLPERTAPTDPEPELKPIPDIGEWELSGLPEGFELTETAYSYNEGTTIMLSGHFQDWDSVRVTGGRLKYDLREDGQCAGVALDYSLGCGGTSTRGGSQEAITYEIVEVNGMFGLVVRTDSSADLTWQDREREMRFEVSGSRLEGPEFTDFTTEELVELAERAACLGPVDPITRDMVAAVEYDGALRLTGAGADPQPEDFGMTVVHGTWNYDPEKAAGGR